VVAGGGVVGAACAYYLSRRGLDVILIERAGIAAGSSSATQSVVGYGLTGDAQHLDLQIAAMAAYDDLVERGLEFGFVREGAIVVPDGPEEETPLRACLDDRNARGLRCAWVGGDDVRALEPAVAPSVVGAAYLPEVGHVSPMRLAVELVRAAHRHGARIWCETTLEAVELASGNTFEAARTSRGRVAAHWLVLATGCWSRSVGMLAGLRVPVWPRKGHVLVIEPVRRLLSRPVVDFGYGRHPSIAPSISEDGPAAGPAEVFGVVQPLPTGQTLVGGSRQFAGSDRSVDPTVVPRIAERAIRMIPALASLGVIRMYTGFRPWTPDGLPMVGPTSQADGIVFATGHGGDGITESVVTGRIVADLLLGTDPPLDAAPLTPDRFRMTERTRGPLDVRRSR
jgi:glycine/D-amino acid oxidase-like deaminating enzyme